MEPVAPQAHLVVLVTIQPHILTEVAVPVAPDPKLAHRRTPPL